MAYANEEEDFQPSNSAVKNANTQAADNDDLDVEFGDADAASNTDGLDRIQPADKKTVVRCAALTDIAKMKMAWGHFIINAEGKKVFIRCQSKRDKKHVILEMGECCKKLNHDDDQKAQLNFAVLALKYINADPVSGKYSSAETPIQYEIGWIKLSRAGFKAIGDLVQEGEQAHDFDFAIGHQENKIGYRYLRVAAKARFRQNPQLLAEVQAEAAKYADGEILKKRLGKVITVTDMKALLAGGKVSASKGQQIDNTDDI